MSPMQFYVSVAIGPLATLIVVALSILINNSRFNDLNQRITDLNIQINKRIEDTRDLLRAEIAKSHSELLMKFAELDSRLTRIEGHLNLK